MMPVIVESNVDRWADQFARVLDDFGFASPADEGPMGEAIVKEVAGNISERGYAGRGHDRDFDANKPKYLKEKVRSYGETRPDVRTEQMLSPESVEGEQEVRQDGKELLWRYGKDVPSPRARTKRDRTTTDRQKARYAHAGPSGNNDRPFFGYNAGDEDDARKIAESALDRHLKSK